MRRDVVIVVTFLLRLLGLLPNEHEREAIER